MFKTVATAALFAASVADAYKNELILQDAKEIGEVVMRLGLVLRDALMTASTPWFS